MNEFTSVRRIIQEADRMEQGLIEIAEAVEALEQWDWDEIFAFAPNSEMALNDLLTSLDCIKSNLHWKLGGQDGS